MNTLILADFLGNLWWGAACFLGGVVVTAFFGWGWSRKKARSKFK